MNRSGYDTEFAGENRAVALRTAHDIRKFEIELYWKRANYFWLFIGATFAAFYVVYSDDTDTAKHKDFLLHLISYVGFALSVAWYFVNRASKYWQLNWETHVDFLEGDQDGQLYKTVLSGHRGCNDFWRNWNGAYKFSVSKINTVISLYFCAFWFAVDMTIYTPIATCLAEFWEANGLWLSPIVMIGLALILFITGRTDPIRDKNGNIITAYRDFDQRRVQFPNDQE